MGDLPPSSYLLSPGIGEDLHGRISPGCPHDSAARMGRRAAHVEAVDWRFVLGPAGRGAQEEQLLERQLALADVALRQTPDALQVQWRAALAMQDEPLEGRPELRQWVD